MSHYVYAICAAEASRKCDYAVKLGYSSNPEGRRRSLQTGCWAELWIECLWEFKNKHDALTVEQLLKTFFEHDYGCEFRYTYSAMGEWVVTRIFPTRFVEGIEELMARKYGIYMRRANEESRT